MPPFERHVFVCHNVRPADAPRRSCTTDGKSELHTRLQQLAKEAGLSGKVRINKSGCLDQCEHGPNVVVYPEAVWYGNVKPEDAEAIVAEHLVAGRPVERLRIADACLNSKTCPHQSMKGRNYVPLFRWCPGSASSSCSLERSSTSLCPYVPAPLSPCIPVYIPTPHTVS